MKKRSANKTDINIPSNLVNLQSGMSNRYSRTKANTINGNVYNYKPLITLIIILLFLVFATIYYVNNADKLGKRSNIVGDGVCNSFPNEEGRDNCCFNFHKDDITIKCIGNWRFLSGIKECQFICENNLPICPEDAKVCPDNKIVRRNASDECNFDDC